jgi:hypothetical protein
VRAWAMPDAPTLRAAGRAGDRDGRGVPCVPGGPGRPPGAFQCRPGGLEHTAPFSVPRAPSSMPGRAGPGTAHGTRAIARTDLSVGMRTGGSSQAGRRRCRNQALRCAPWLCLVEPSTGRLSADASGVPGRRWIGGARYCAIAWSGSRTPPRLCSSRICRAGMRFSIREPIGARSLRHAD